MQRSTMQDAISAPRVGGIVRLTRFILRGTFLVELIGALAMLPVFCRDYGWHGIWMAVFHSISAFCNAGFDILGTNGNLYPSLTGYVQNPVINITIMLLIITGGIGFLTWDDICENKLHFHRYRMQSKVILVTTLTLIVLPALFFFFVDFDALPLRERVQAALFQSVTPRTAGFNTVDLPAMSGASLGVMILLMLIGGSPGSTAGGMKTTTLAVLLANAAATFRQRDSAQFFGRRVDCSAVKTAATILSMYLALFFGGAVFHAILVDDKLLRRHRPFLSLAQILIRGTARRPPAARRQRSRGEQPHQHSQRKDHCQQSPFHGIFLLAQTWIWHTAAVCKNRCFSYGASIPSIMPLSGLRRLPGQALKRPRQRNSTVHNSSPPL